LLAARRSLDFSFLNMNTTASSANLVMSTTGVGADSLVLSTMFLERLAVAGGHDSVDVVSGPLLAQVHSGALNRGWIAHRFERAWAAEVASHVATDRVAKREDQGGFGSTALLNSVESLVEDGEFDQARAQLEAFGWYDKRQAGRAFALAAARRRIRPAIRSHSLSEVARAPAARARRRGRARRRRPSAPRSWFDAQPASC
jgi:hypothetical protein